ncbi:hypothetical protein GQ457_04G020990 [Hibiscus cannabinus]
MRGAFGSCVWRSGVKRCFFRLRQRGGSEHFGGSSLVVLDMGLTRGSDMGYNGFQQPESSGSDHVSGVIGDLKRDSHVRLSSQIVNLVGLDIVEPATKRGSVGEVSVMDLHASLVGVVAPKIFEPPLVVDTLCIEVGGAADQPLDLIPFVQQEFRQVRIVLSDDAREQGDLALRSGASVGGVRSRSGSDPGTVTFGFHFQY